MRCRCRPVGAVVTRLCVAVLALTTCLLTVPAVARAQSPVAPLPELDTWAWCGVHPDDPAATQIAEAMADVSGIDVTFGPCNVPTPDYTPADTANRYVDPITYSRLVATNAAAGMKTVVYDRRLWSDTKSVRDTAIAFWQPMLANIAAWDMGDEFDPAGAEWSILVHRWGVVRANVTSVTGVPPYANQLPTQAAINAALHDLPGSEQLISFARYTGDLGEALIRQTDPRSVSVMCGVNAFTHSVLRPSAASIRADMTVLRAAGCDKYLVFGGQRVYGTDLFGPSSLVERDGTATDWAAAVREGSGRSSYTPVGPGRLLETRTGPGLSTVDGQYQGVGVRGTGSFSQVQVVGRAGVPRSAVAVAITVTVINARAPGYVTVYPCDTDVPNASQLNYASGATVSATVVAKVAASGWVCVFTQADVDMAVDVAGYYPAGSTYVPSSPARLLETRAGDGLATVDGQSLGVGVRLGGSITELQVRGRGGVPANAGIAALSVTAVDARAPGFVTVYPCGEPAVPTASTVNYGTGGVVANAIMAALDANGRVCLYTSADVDLVVDVSGSFPVGSTSVPVAPVRLLETRTGPGLSTVDGQFLGIGKRQIDTVTQVQIGGRAGLPATASSVVLNLTVTGPTGPGFVTVFPCAAGRPNAASINFVAGQTVANLVVADLDAAGRLCLYTMVPTDLIIDVVTVQR